MLALMMALFFMVVDDDDDEPGPEESPESVEGDMLSQA